MNTLIAIFSVLFGLAFGSFLNVCISRLPRSESVISPRSRCPRCHVSIRTTDNIPLVSWLALRGRCRDCHARIPFRYFLVEATTAALFLLCFLRFGLSVPGVGAAVFCFLLLGLAVMDAETMLLPDAFTLPGIGLGVLYCSLVANTGSWWPEHPHFAGGGVAATTALMAAGLILLIRWLYWLARRQEGMGLGDAKLLAMIGAWLGPTETLLAFFLAVVTGAIYGMALLLVTRRGDRQPLPSRVPFGAFLCLASTYALSCGETTLRWYFDFLR